MQKTKALSWYQKSGKAEYKSRQIFVFLLGYMLRKFQGDPWSLIMTLHMSASFLMTLSRAGFLTLASGTGHKQVSDNNLSHGLKLRPTCSSWNILCKDPWTNVNGYFIDYFLGTTAEGFVLSHASLKNNKHLNILPSQLNQRKEGTSQNHKS